MRSWIGAPAAADQRASDATDLETRRDYEQIARTYFEFIQSLEQYLFVSQRKRDSPRQPPKQE
jgi:hypothetical protein